ncbi:3-phosphoshikimate 1-carboxyvinyltransferase [Rhodovibrio sodomensis]|uniref:3-phosphoshikimate 1-carboxyvinyltransferase n=1 Tax=Rhodovibrio sodomensis TaxID=1088 RepID=A0ABS1DM93_9PROT|nr:3-phosphoshikimate 1-carboxyvinyltransferase [Rhodovibrio sodomensis]MBK1670849.1 3-phosphoshikimate 1-carboxyvinyltransferase [Rhodovibrio sodomensis]
MTDPHAPPRPLTARPAEGLSGRAAVPGDKSISHRALMLGALAAGETTIHGLLTGADVIATADAMAALGATIHRGGPGESWRVRGRGVGALVEPEGVLDLGNSGTSARLLMGVLAGHPVSAVITGDASLRRRPMGRVIEPLSRIGAQISARSGGRLPLTVTGTADPLPLEYVLPVASAQVKSAVLLAGLNAPGETSVIEPEETRDHTELMLSAFGAEVRVERTGQGRRSTLVGEAELTGRLVRVPADPSSAAFPLVAGLLVPGSRVDLPAVGMNPHRTGLFTTLREMGAALSVRNERTEAGEPVADLIARAGPLQAVEVPASRAPSMIDEYPILCVAAALAEGRSVMHGIAELRVKESDRLDAMARGLEACGVRIEEGEDWLAVHGTGGRRPAGGASLDARLDHRIAMSFLILGLVSEAGVSVDDVRPIDTSFPGFDALMTGLGALLKS